MINQFFYSLSLVYYFSTMKQSNKIMLEIKNQALKQINVDNQKIKDEIIKEDTLYKLVAGSDEKSIVNGDKFEDSEVKKWNKQIKTF